MNDNQEFEEKKFNLKDFMQQEVEKKFNNIEHPNLSLGS